MITATFKKKNNQFIGYEIKGHANYAPEGQDIVCAAVSALAMTITNELNNSSKTIIRNIPGELEVRLTNFNTNINLLINCLLNGLKMISLNYSDHLTVVELK